MKKRWIAMLLVFLLLSGCASSRSYLLVRPHEEQYVTEENADARVVDDYKSLCTALQALITRHETTGVLRAYSYSGDISDDAAKAVYYAAKRTSVGSFAVDYITYECARVVSYDEITVNITYARPQEKLDEMIQTRGSNAVKIRIAGAVERCEESLLMYVFGYEPFDVGSYVQEYYWEHPATMQALPEVRCTCYPEEGEECIIEVLFSYPLEPEVLQARQKEVQDVVHAAVDYVQHREGENEKLQLLYLYLAERFDYRQESSVTPVYSVLCEGTADSVGFSRAMQILCDALEIPCWTVSGTYGGAPWNWNIVELAGQCYHVDAMHAVLSNETDLALNLDSAMTAYTWNPALYPACSLKPETWPGYAEGGMEENILPGT